MIPATRCEATHAKRRRLLWALPLALFGAVGGCSGNSFDVSAAEQDSGSASDVSVEDGSDGEAVDTGVTPDAPDTSTGSDAAPDDTSKPADTGLVDVGAIDAGPACSAATLVAFDAEADAQILQSAPTLNWGGAGAMGSRNDLSGPMFALVRFDVASLPATAKILSVVLDLPWASHATDCATGCGSCAGIDHDGTHDVYFMRSDWGEGKVTWSTRDGSAPWGTAGAMLSGVDRSTGPAATFVRAKGASASVSLGADTIVRLSDWRSSANKLSFLVQAEASAVFLIASREGKMLCSGSGPAPKLTIKYCSD